MMGFRSLLLVLLSVLLSTGGCTPVPPDPVADTRFTYEVVNVYPHDPLAFTQGLVYVNGESLEGTGLYGESSLRRVAVESGEVLQQQGLSDDYFGEGITLLNGVIYQITWREHTAFSYDAATFERTGVFNYGGEGWGLTHDGTRLIMSDGTAWLRFMDPATFAELGRVEVLSDGLPVRQLNELEYIDGKVWANVWRTDSIVIIDPATGEVTATVDLEGLLNVEKQTPPPDVLNGIAYDADHDRTFVTGKRWPRLYEIRLVPVDDQP